MAKVAFMGLGNMGREMALRLLDAGHQVTVCNRTSAKAEPLVERGAVAAATPAAAMADVEYIISMVSDDDASHSVWLGSDGVLAGKPKSSAIAIESSTLSLGWVKELSDEVMNAGLRYLDCPVTGGPDGAAEGTLTLLLGGDEDTIEAIADVTSAYSNRRIVFGPVGAGTTYKLIVNLMGAVQGAALAEGLAVGEKAGLDLAKVAEALTAGAVASPHVKYLTERMVAGNHEDVYFSAGLRHKDADYGVKMGESMKADLTVSKAALDIYRRAIDLGFADKNSSVIYDLLKR